ncbi:MAG: ABC transporter substrate-binding protein [Patulibacter sp.]
MRRPAFTALAGVLAAASGLLTACGDRQPSRSSPPNAGPRAATIAVGALPRTLDPARASSVAERAIAAATQTPLLTYRRTAGDEAATLTPALAGALPQLSLDAREYRFQLRRGLVYADGALVKASDVERAIAHASADATDGELRTVLASIVGAPSRDGATLSGVRSDDRSGMVVVRLRHADGRVPFALADPATAPQPSLPKAGEIPASTGPLRIASSSKRSVVLAANPLRATISTVPAARLAQLSLVLRPSGASARELAGGTVDLDLTAAAVSSRGSARGARASAATLVTGPSTSVVAAVVAQRGALAARTVRRALAAAIDRRDAGSAASGAAPTCGLLPPFAVGAVDREPCPAPPAAPLRRLLTGVQVTVAVPRGEAWSAATEAILREAIDALGGTASFAASRAPLEAAASGAADIAVARVTPRLPHPSFWLEPAASFDALLAREVPRLTAGPLTGTGGRWAALDRRVVDRGVVMPLLALERVAVVGRQVDRRTVLLHPLFGLDLAALDLA